MIRLQGQGEIPTGGKVHELYPFKDMAELV